MNKYDSCGHGGGFDAEDAKQRICYIDKGCVVMGYHIIDADEDTGEVVENFYTDAAGEKLEGIPELVTCPDLSAFAGCGGSGGGSLTEQEIIDLIKDLDKYCPECFTKDSINELIKIFMNDNSCECLSIEDVIDIIIKAVDTNNKEIVLHMIKAIVVHPDAVDVQDAFGAHQYTALP